jgi:hypothetical protein
VNTDAADHRELNEYVTRLLEGKAGNQHMDAGRRIWMNKVIVTHLAAKEMNNAVEDLRFKLRMTKSEELAIHFTSKESARLILHGYGIRESSEGQVSTQAIRRCLRFLYLC